MEPEAVFEDPFHLLLRHGRSTFHLAAVIFILAAGRRARCRIGELERNAFAQTGYYVLAVTLSVVLFIALRWSNHSRGQSERSFCQSRRRTGTGAILPLSLSRDGIPVR